MKRIFNADIITAVMSFCAEVATVTVTDAAVIGEKEFRREIQ